MIGGIIVLSLFLIALVAMVVVSQQYDSYQSTVNAMSQKDIDRASEKLQGVIPGVSWNGQVSTGNCATNNCNSYAISLANLGISTQIARMYIVTNIAASPPPSTDIPCSPCILDPAPVDASGNPIPTPNTFQGSQSLINPGEPYHQVTVWLPGNVQLIWSNPVQLAESQSISVVTTRGRVFSFLYPFPAESQPAAGPEGGTGLQIGPIVITFQKELITYTISNVYGTPYGTSNPALPMGGTGGEWDLPGSSTPIILYVKIELDWWAKSDVYLTAQSVIEFAQYNSPGTVTPFYVVATPTTRLCNIFKNSPGGDLTVDCSSSYSNTVGTDGDPANLAAYASCGVGITPAQYFSNPGGQPSVCGSNYRYRIPKPTVAQHDAQQRGNPVYVAFGSKVAGQGGNNNKQSINWNGGTMSYLFFQYVYNDGTPYVYGVTLPFVAVCSAIVNHDGSLQPCSPGL
jgi:hypothetical protein